MASEDIIINKYIDEYNRKYYLIKNTKGRHELLQEQYYLKYFAIIEKGLKNAMEYVKEHDLKLIREKDLY